MLCLTVDPFPARSMYPVTLLCIHLLSCFLKHAGETKSNRSRDKSALWGWCQPPWPVNRRGTLSGQSGRPCPYFLGTSCGPCHRLGPLCTLSRQSSQQSVGPHDYPKVQVNEMRQRDELTCPSFTRGSQDLAHTFLIPTLLCSTISSYLSWLCQES